MTRKNEGNTFRRNVGNCSTTQRHISEDQSPHLHCCKNSKLAPEMTLDEFNKGDTWRLLALIMHTENALICTDAHLCSQRALEL
jgi:hypothetical protein